jgi:SagB-type dehydrogenase family enzyme
VHDDHVPCPFTLSLLPGAAFEVRQDGSVWISVGRKRKTIGMSSPGVVATLEHLATGSVSEETLRRRAVEVEDFAGLSALYHCLLELSSSGLLCYEVRDGERPLLTAIPVGGQCRPGFDRLDPAARLVASRFAFSRRDGAATVLESPLSFARVLVSDWRGAAILAAFATPSSLDDLGPGGLGLPSDVFASCVGLLWAFKFLSLVDGTGASEEDANSELEAWEFHDLVFHSRSRRGRHRSPYGATYRLRGRLEPLPAIKPRMSDEVMPLFRPDLDGLLAVDSSFTTVLENRCSRRQHDAVPITGRQLGEFLYRTCRIRGVISAGSREPYEATNRVYPSGGAAYPLEVYLVVHRCAGVPAGLYHYQPNDHALARLSQPSNETDTLIRMAAFAAASGPPQILILLAARMGRVAWKYSSIAYAVILKDVGVLYQTMYLVATAMGLAGCALGGGNADVFARATGLSYCGEPAVGEFILGSAAVRPSG